MKNRLEVNSETILGVWYHDFKKNLKSTESSHSNSILVLTEIQCIQQNNFSKFVIRISLFQKKKE